MRIATTTRVTFGVVLGAAAGIGIWLAGASPSRRSPISSFVAPPAALDLELSPTSSSVQHEPPAPPSQPFYASLFVAGTTWTLPCTWEVGTRLDRTPSNEAERCHVESVEVTKDESRARIACLFVHDPDTRKDPAINTYVMTTRGLYINGTTGEPMFTPHPVAKPLPKRWAMDEPRGPDGEHASAMVRHDGAWCSVYAFQGTDVSFGATQCISKHGIAGFSDHRDGIRQRCGDVP